VVRTALLDANVLHPMVLCDLLIRLALSGFYRPLWSDEILHEVVRSIHGRRPDLSLELLQKRVEKMKRVLPDATVSGYERLLPDLAMLGSDAHVLAAAAEGGANVIVTFNTTDFAAAIRSRYDVGVESPDEFLSQAWASIPDAVIRILREQSLGTTRPHISPEGILNRLAPLVPQFASSVRESQAFTEPDPTV
jgi:predicted nucleic acid-binding protein